MGGGMKGEFQLGLYISFFPLQKCPHRGEGVLTGGRHRCRSPMSRGGISFSLYFFCLAGLSCPCFVGYAVAFGVRSRGGCFGRFGVSSIFILFHLASGVSMAYVGLIFRGEHFSRQVRARLS